MNSLVVPDTDIRVLANFLSNQAEQSFNAKGTTTSAWGQGVCLMVLCGV